MRKRRGNSQWEGILFLLMEIYAQTARFKPCPQALDTAHGLRGIAMDLAFIGATTEEGKITPENLMPLFLMREKLTCLGTTLAVCRGADWVMRASLHSLEVKVKSLAGQIDFQIAQSEQLPLPVQVVKSLILNRKT